MNADSKKQVWEALQALDKDGTGKISVDKLTTALKELNPDIADDIPSITSQLKVVDGKTTIADFMKVVFDDDRPPASAVMKPEELEEVKKIFQKYDKDKSNKIDLSELQAMCTEMGKKLNGKQVKKAIIALDKNEDGKVDFDEFVLWFSNAGTGTAALDLVKRRLGMAHNSWKFVSCQHKKVDDPSMCSIKACVDLTPNFVSGQGSEEKASVNVKVAQGQTSDDQFIARLKLKAKDDEAARLWVEGYKKLEQAVLGQMRREGGPEADLYEQVMQVAHEKNIVTFTATAAKEMYTESETPEGLQAMNTLAQCITKGDVAVSVGTNFEEIVNNPSKPIVEHFKGGKIKGDVDMSVEQFAAFLDATDAFPPPMQAAIKLFAGMALEIAIGFDQSEFARALTKIIGFAVYPDGNYFPVLSATRSLDDVRFALYSAFSDKISQMYRTPEEERKQRDQVEASREVEREVAISRQQKIPIAAFAPDDDLLGLRAGIADDEEEKVVSEKPRSRLSTEKPPAKKDERTPEETESDAFNEQLPHMFEEFVKDTCKRLVGFEQIQLIPAKSVIQTDNHIAITFDQFNPFALGDYLMQTWPKRPDMEIDATADDETKRLAPIFIKYRQDARETPVEMGYRYCGVFVWDLQGALEEACGGAKGSLRAPWNDEMFEKVEGAKWDPSFDDFKFLVWLCGTNYSPFFKETLLRVRCKALTITKKGQAMVTSSTTPADTVVKWSSEVTPALAGFSEKMAATASIDLADVQPVGFPRIVLALTAKSEGDAQECVTKWNEALQPMKAPIATTLAGVFESTGFLPEFKQDGKNIILTISFSDEMAQQFILSFEEVLRLATPASKWVQGSSVKVSFANTFDEFVASPDQPIQDLFAGAKCTGLLSLSAIGRNMLLCGGAFFLPERMKQIYSWAKMWGGFMNSEEMDQVAPFVMLQMAKIFTGSDVKLASGWHKQHVAALMSLLPIPDGLSPTASTLKGMISGAASSLDPMLDDVGSAPVEVQAAFRFGQALVKTVDKLEAIESLAVENFHLPMAFSLNGKDATVGVQVKLENFKPFALMTDLMEPIFRKIKAKNI